VESNKVIPKKVDTLKNIVDSLTKYVSVWEVILVHRGNGNCCPSSMNKSSGISCFIKEDNKWDNVGFLYSFQ
jgi:hypothetical protein